MKAQTAPVLSWSFDSPASIIENGLPSEIDGLNNQYDILTENRISFIRVKPEAETGYLRLKQDVPDNFTLSFWFRLPEDAYSEDMRLFWTQDNSLIFRLSNRQMSFQTRIKDGTGGFIKDDWNIPFDGSNTESFSRLLDNNWHQLTIQYHSRTGKKGIFIDGKQPSSWTKTVDRKGRICGATPCNSSLQFNHSRRTNQLFEGDLAQVEVYDQCLDAERVDALYKSQVVAFNGQNTTPIRSRNLSEAPAFDEREFVPVQSEQAPSAEDQLSSFQLPR